MMNKHSIVAPLLRSPIGCRASWLVSVDSRKKVEDLRADCNLHSSNFVASFQLSRHE